MLRMPVPLSPLAFAYFKGYINERLLCKRVVHVGSNANNSAKVGVFYVNANNDSSNANSNIGTHLCLLQPYT